MNAKLMKSKLSICVLALFCSIAFAVVSPLIMMQNVAGQMLSSLTQNQSKLKSNPAIISSIVHSTLIPHVDADRMAGSVLGRDYWNKATPAQRKEFIRSFTTLVISTYSAALASFDGDVIQFYPLRGGYNNVQSIQINSVIQRKNGQTIPINYNLELQGGKWMIYDFVIANISMVQSYRSQFATTLASGGLPALLQKLQQQTG